MKKLKIETTVKKMLADIYTPVGIYLRLRDRFRDTILLESTDNQAAENSWSFIGVNAIAGIEVSMQGTETKMPNGKPEKLAFAAGERLPDVLWQFMQRFELEPANEPAALFAQGLYGYFTFEAAQRFDTIRFKKEADTLNEIPMARYRLYQYVIAINHFKDELFLCENKADHLESERSAIESLLKSKDVPLYPFQKVDSEQANISPEAYIESVKRGIASCYRGDVFQIVLGRRFQQRFQGDEFAVYRALRSINPSPYLFFFDYGDYKLMGSSPESQLILKDGKAIVHPIAGTFRRTGDAQVDAQKAAELLEDAKENAEHVMLVDLARNDLSTVCTNVKVASYRQVHYYSHVIHLVSEVQGNTPTDINPFEVLAKTFPAGTLSGAPKFRAMQLIDEIETTPRSFYGGAIGFVGFNGSCNHAIMIRSFLSKNNTLIYQAGAGIVAASVPEKELAEVDHKLNALKQALALAETLV
ncbi:MAG TPA: anthranilate synthase component I family protein [Chitinophagaceae bacterium]|nr:anthranilate synthase component I family protein [Chitinophagaceae bacterium]